jgi:hypothetical protein
VGFENGRLLRVTIRATSVSLPERVTTFHYNLTNASEGLENNNPQDLADRFRDDVIPAWKIWFPAAFTLQPVVVADEIDPQNPTAPRSEWSSGTPTAGTNSSGTDLLPPGVCALVKLVTNVVGRRFNGRSFAPFVLDESAESTGVLSTAAIAAFQTAYAAVPIEPDIAGGGGLSDARAHLCVYSRTARAANADPYATDVASFLVRPQTHYLRRRAGT